MGRTGRFKSSAILVALQTGEAAATMARCDIGCSEGAAAALQGPVSARPLTAIVHAGGLLADSVIPNQTLEGIKSVFAPKVGHCPHLGCAPPCGVRANPIDSRDVRHGPWHTRAQ